ncbi:hypothetical protein [Serratia microhaemolytica]|uniref:hypothetical protein n=1 Tax=Serratia microhaemolytica TaxID=2675110 RepID=UPI000FDEC69E|nr:hypothetical protein [Serratia microhaemolytica]
MSEVHLSIIHRLPFSYRWVSGYVGTKLEVVSETAEPGNVTTDACSHVAEVNSSVRRPTQSVNSPDHLIGLRLLSQQGQEAWQAMQQLQHCLLQVYIECVLLEWQGEPCLFVAQQDESAAICRLKNIGVAIAEKIDTRQTLPSSARYGT